MTAPSPSPSGATTPFQFTLTREFAAPLARVWAACTKPELLVLWFSPKGVTPIGGTMDLRPGGHYHYGLRNPDGSTYWGRWIFLEVVPEQRFSFLMSFSDEQMGITRHPMAPQWPAEIHSTMIFTAKGDRTEIAMRAYAHNASAEERAIFEAGAPSMTAGWGGTLAQLDALLAR
jgi:uncharacterized protein YndB with AHSA1/START domain